MIAIFIDKVLPCFSSVDWTGCRGSIALSEVFAFLIWDYLVRVMETIKEGRTVEFDESVPAAVLREANALLQKAEDLWGATESQLADDECNGRYSRIQVLQKRAMWPMAEYKCRFSVGGELIPVEFDLINIDCLALGACRRSLTANTRRAMRQSGWMVRDRFIRVLIDLREPFASSMVDWLASNPVLCGRRYEFLFDKGVSKNTKCFLFAPTLGMTRDDFLRSLGCFSDVQPAKTGDRIGLAFSQTAPIAELKPAQIIAMPEVTRNGYRFSDGCGVMGLGVARKVQQAFNLKRIPGAIQVRLGGVKGMLSLKIDFDHDSVGIRPSQVKFSSTSRILEVKKHSRAIKGQDAWIFRDLVYILDQSVPSNVFYKLATFTACELALKYDYSCTSLRNMVRRMHCTAEEEYWRNVLRNGRKMNGSHFSISEIERIKDEMKTPKEKVKLRCSVQIYQGVMDEYDMLEEGQILVGNGAVTGSVLVARSPALFPGDIQRAEAIRGFREDARYIHLNECVVFSSMGARPLADMLGGGDLDGDEFFVINDAAILDNATMAEPHDYGSSTANTSGEIDIELCFPLELRNALAPSLKEQLNVLKRFLDAGNLVSKSKDAFDRIVDKFGVESIAAQEMAELHQYTLDARKHSFAISESKLVMMQKIINSCPSPAWKSKKRGRRKSEQTSTSICGVLYEQWCVWTEKLDILQRKLDTPLYGSADLEREEQAIVRRNELAGESMRKLDQRKRSGEVDRWELKLCDECLGAITGSNNRKCKLCDEVWLCSDECESKHWRLCYKTRWASTDPAYPIATPSTPTESAGSLVPVKEKYVIVDADVTFNDNDLARDILEGLVDVVFGRKIPSCFGLGDIDWRCLRRVDLDTMAEMVLVEFFCSLRKGLKECKGRRGTVDTPHVYDVFSMKPRLQRGNIDLATYLPVDSLNNLLMWSDENGNTFPLDPPFHRYRVANLAGTARVIESLKSEASQGTLVHHAMTRNPNLIQTVLDEDAEAFSLLDPSIAQGLNTAQKQAVGTVVVKGVYREGFFVVVGPPGTGKTVTLCRMVEGLGGGIVLGPSNASVANVVLKMTTRGFFKDDDLCVLGEGCDESVRRFSPIFRYRRYKTFTRQLKDAKTLIEKEHCRRRLALWLGLDYSELSKAGSTIDAKFQELCPNVDDRKGHHRLKQILMSSKVILCTLNTAGSKLLRSAITTKFDTVFLDEAGQCPEADFYIACTMPSIKRIVLIGDPKQLPATVLDPDCRNSGYQDSWMAHVVDQDLGSVHMLNVQYRSDPEILEFSNIEFYSGKIRTSSSVSRRIPKVKQPFAFVDTGCESEQIRVGTSYKNPLEAEAVRRLLCSREDKDIMKVRKANPQATCMVITPYLAQKDLLLQTLENVSHSMAIRVATVDSFQGQEGDIVIVSLVRTNGRIQFVDDAQRLNVALTRAKSVLRIVGCLEFFKGLNDSQSTLAKLAHFAGTKLLLHSVNIKNRKNRAVAWRPPDWKQERVWRVTLTQRFHNCLNEMSLEEKNVALNTLLKIATPDIKALSGLPSGRVRDSPCWQLTGLRGFDHLQIVWIARNGVELRTGDREKPRPIVNAHFAGKKKKCLHFIQTHPLVPMGACTVRRDLSGINQVDVEKPLLESAEIVLSWNVTNDIRDAVLGGTMLELPDGCFELDPKQVAVLLEKPPLLLESRSGTGKTNVLFQHAVAYARDSADKTTGRPIAFITVSPRLRSELSRRYSEVQRIEQANLPPIQFFSLEEILDGLLAIAKLDDKMKTKDKCSYLEYLHSRTSYTNLRVEPSEIENEVGGVIMGSLEAAIKKEPLDRKEYLENIRSNVPTSNKEGVDKRHAIYDEYDQYRGWKIRSGKFDVNDVILQLIRLNLPQLFDSAYLDEVQDFNYAAIYLICTVAGKDSLNWVCAGDTAQMISVGCCFKFDGLKQVMRNIRPGIESSLKKVVNLKVNYRVTKDILKVSNSILDVAKKNFPEAIEYAVPEEAIKDLGFKVSLCLWHEAMKVTTSFGTNQALIFSSEDDQENVYKDMKEWLGDHPFILSSLESKGLEFDDCVVAFDFERKAWNVDGERVSSLRLLRELYVAVTRAKERVVLLVKKESPAMHKFFESLQCDLFLEDANVVFMEFDRGTTTPDEWFRKGNQLFEERQYKMAASCYKSAAAPSYANWAQGLHENQLGRKDSAASAFRTSARLFLEQADYESTLDLLSLVMDIPPWDESDDLIYDAARRNHPSYFTAEKTVRFALKRSKYNEIRVDHLNDPVALPLVLAQRDNPLLKEAICNFPEEDITALVEFAPTLAGDMYSSRAEYVRAVELYLCGRDYLSAEASTVAYIEKFKADEQSHGLLQGLVKLWQSYSEAIELLTSGSSSALLVQLFSSPREVARTRAKDCLAKLGRDIIKCAVAVHEDLSDTDLYAFDPDEFDAEVSSALTERHQEELIRAVRWYVSQNDPTRASIFASKHWSTWSYDEILGIIVGELKLRPNGLLDECSHRSILIALVEMCLKDKTWDIDLAFEATNIAITSKERAEKDASQLISIWYSRRNDARVTTKTKLAPHEPKPSKAMLFLNLIIRPKALSQSEKQLCMAYFGAKVVEVCVKRSLANNAYPVLHFFDSSAFNHLRPEEDRAHNPTPKPSSKEQNKSTARQSDLRKPSKRKSNSSSSESSESITDGRRTANKNSKSASSDSSISDDSIPPLLGRRHSSSSSDDFGSDDSDDGSPPPLLPRDNHSDSSSASDDSMPTLQRRRQDGGGSRKKGRKRR